MCFWCFCWGCFGTNADNHWWVGMEWPKCSSAICKPGHWNALSSCFQLGCGLPTEVMNMHGKEWKTNKEKYAFKCFVVFPSIFSSKGKLPGQSLLHCQLRKLRQHAHVSAYFKNSHPFSQVKEEMCSLPCCTELWLIDDACSVRKQMLVQKLFPISLRGTSCILFFSWFLE